jgi:hypothetical protein
MFFSVIQSEEITKKSIVAGFFSTILENKE